MSNIYGDFDYIIHKIFREVDDRIANTGYEPKILIVAVDIELMLRRCDEAIRMGPVEIHPLKRIMGLNVLVSGLLPEGGFMLLDEHDVALIEEYKRIIKENSYNVKEDEVNFDMTEFTTARILAKTNVLVGFDAGKR